VPAPRNADAALRPVPQGVSGQLYLGGVQLARGYLRRNDLTDQQFLPDPFRPNERMYATGDRARYRPDGAIEYLGRNDYQVKIRGMRVELGEIEHALRGFKNVKEAIVLARTDLGPHTQLIAYVLCQTTFDTAQAQCDLTRLLPAHMVPTDIIALPHFPVTANGKLDRKSLPTVFRDKPLQRTTSLHNPPALPHRRTFETVSIHIACLILPCQISMAC